MAPERTITSILTHDNALTGSWNAMRPAAKNNIKSKRPESIPEIRPRFLDIFAVIKPAAKEHRIDTTTTKGGINPCGICSDETNIKAKTASKTAQSAAPDTEPMTTARKISNDGLLLAELLMVTAPLEYTN